MILHLKLNCNKSQGWMEPIEAGSDAERAALAAAQRKDDDPKSKSTPILNSSLVKAFSSSLTKMSERVMNFVKDQASKILSGSKPYRFQCTFSTVNFIVICSLIVVFADTFKYSFYVKSGLAFEILLL